MDEKPLIGSNSDELPAVLFPGANSTERRHLAELKAAGRIRPVGPRLYVSVPEADTATAIRKAWSTIVARLFPDVLLTHRTALEFHPTLAGEVFLTTSFHRVVTYPGLVLKFFRGPGPLPDDPGFLTLRSSSQARAFLENLSKGRSSSDRVVPIEELEARLEQILHLDGEAGLNALRDRAREIADELRWNAEFKRLDGLIGVLLGTRRCKGTSLLAQARAAGEPFADTCLNRLTLLFAELRAPLPVVRDTFSAADHARNKAFFEAYFSNYIEGTTFEVSEAEEILFDKKIPANRPKDGHDIAGTFAIVSDQNEMLRVPGDFEEFLQLLCSRHKTMMAQRPEAEPGQFKTKSNRAGDTHFVHPDYVRGTLRKGWEFYRGLGEGLPRAIFLAFLVSEVHPFVDGNGRVLRIMMNAELTAAGQATIIIPTVFRDSYLQALRALSRTDRPAPFVQAMVKAQRFSHLEFSPYHSVLQELKRRNWFREPDEANLIDTLLRTAAPARLPG